MSPHLSCIHGGGCIVIIAIVVVVCVVPGWGMRSFLPQLFLLPPVTSTPALPIHPLFPLPNCAVSCYSIYLLKKE